jgi:hypothetical protein
MLEQHPNGNTTALRKIRGFQNGTTVRDITSGSWYFDAVYDDHYGTGGAFVCDEVGNTIAEVQGRNDRETLANGNLIAAAPALYQALVSVMWELRGREESGEIKWCGAWNSAIRAIERCGGTDPWKVDLVHIQNADRGA